MITIEEIFKKPAEAYYVVKDGVREWITVEELPLHSSCGVNYKVKLRNSWNHFVIHFHASSDYRVNAFEFQP